MAAAKKGKNGMSGTFFTQKDAPAPYYRVSGERMERIGESVYRVRRGVFTTCEDDPPAWSFHFDEATADGRGREMAFRALTSLNDERPLPFMRQLVTSEAEPAYRLRAIKYVTAQGDRQALGGLQVVMQSPTEQASIRDAAAQAYRAINGR